MKVTYDAHTDTLTVILRDGVPVAESHEDKPGDMLDYDEQRNMISLEVLDASRRVGDAREIECETIAMTRAVWQISAGLADRACADLFLKYGVGLIGPGDAGPWEPERDDDEFEGGFVRRFASEVQVGDVFLLRTGVSRISAVGIVASDYLYLDQFDDVNGWDLQHGRRVRWYQLPETYDFTSLVFGANPPTAVTGVEPRGPGLRRALPQVPTDLLADGSAA